MAGTCDICERKMWYAHEDDGDPPVDIERCVGSGGFECRAVKHAIDIRKRNEASKGVECARFMALLRCGGSIVSTNALSSEALVIARAADRVFVDKEGFGYVYVLGPMEFRERDGK